MFSKSARKYTQYEEELREFRLVSSKAGALTAIVLVMAGVGLDYGIYPNEQFRFFVVRSVVSALIGLIYLLLSKPLGRRYVQLLTLSWLIAPQIMVAWMISVTEGASSIYYAGLNLVIFAVGIALPMGLWQTIGFGAVTYAFYFLACLLHHDGLADRSHFIVNSLFILFSITASAVYTFMNERGHVHLYRLKEELARRNRELAQTNRSLAEIKGQMLQQEKMAAIGTLAAGLLHEVNNPVNFCLMAIEVAMEEPAAKANPSLEECLVDARQGMQRIQHIVSDLKTFAYRKPGADTEGTPFLFEKALDSACRLTAHELRGVQLSRELPSDTLVFGDEAAIIGVLINLYSNAALAMRKAGTVAPAIHTVVSWVNKRLHVTVRDNGPGIATENLARVFEPFFTTREVGQGLGLGLSISYAVVQRHGGTLFAESEPGNWAAFSFDLPRAE
jgi:two-component system sensor histidine kinase PhcS